MILSYLMGNTGPLWVNRKVRVMLEVIHTIRNSRGHSVIVVLMVRVMTSAFPRTTQIKSMQNILVISTLIITTRQRILEKLKFCLKTEISREVKLQIMKKTKVALPESTKALTRVKSAQILIEPKFSANSLRVKNLNISNSTSNRKGSLVLLREMISLLLIHRPEGKD